MAGLPESGANADVIIVGGGVIGCAVAFRLAQARLSVLILERGEPGAEASTAAAGMLGAEGERVAPEVFADLCVASRDLYPRFVAEIEEASRQNTAYRRDGTLLVALEEKQADELHATFQAQTRRGFRLELLEAAEVARRVPGLAPDLLCGLFVPGDHWLDTERLMCALIESCRRLGVRFHAGQAVTRLNVKNGRVESVEARAGAPAVRVTYSAEVFVLAAGCWSRELVAALNMPLALEPCRGQLVEFEAPEELPLAVRSGLHYLVPRPERRVVVGTTAEYVGFEKAVTGEGLHSILRGATRLAPLVNRLRFRRAWAGLRPDTADHLPILGYGKLANLIFATGHFRNGILLAPVTAQLVSELLLTRTTSHPIEAYTPLRFASRPVPP